MILATEAIPHKSLDVALVKLIEPRLKNAPSVLKMIRERRCPCDLLYVEQDLRDDLEVQRVGEIVWINGWVCAGV